MFWHGNSQNYLFMSQTKTNKKLAESFIQLKHFGDDHNYQTRAKSTILLDIPHFSTNYYGTHSAKYNCIKDWNKFRNNFPSTLLNQCYYLPVKKLLTKHIVDQSWKLSTPYTI